MIINIRAMRRLTNRLVNNGEIVLRIRNANLFEKYLIDSMDEILDDLRQDVVKGRKVIYLA